MTNKNLYALFESRFPADDAAVFLKHDRGTTTFANLRRDSGRIAAVLRQCGVCKGDRVLVQAEKSPECVLLYLACLRAGAVFVPLNTAYTSSEVDCFVGDAKPRVFVCDPAKESEYRRLQTIESIEQLLTLGSLGDGTLIDRLSEAESSDEVCDSSTDDLAAILYTSGTTGRSKGAMITHGNLSSNVQVLHEQWAFETNDILLHTLPIFHVHGLFVALHCALLNASQVLFHTRFIVTDILRDLPHVTVMMGVPTFYTRLLEQPEFNRDLVAGIRMFVSGSAPLLSDTFEEFEHRTGHRILERYGMTETSMITSNPYSGERVAGSVGFALPDIDVRIADSGGSEVPRGDVGILEVRGPNVCLGYWQRPDKTAEEFRTDGFFITGDMATMDKDGRVCIVGRAKDLVISGGYNVYPKEIESEIDLFDGVKESAVIGIPHPDFGEAVAAVVVAEHGEAIDQQQLMTTLAGKLARFKLPKSIFVVDQLPRNTMGKVQKNQLREAYKAVFASK